MKVILINLVGVQMLEELQIKQMIDHRQEVGKRRFRPNLSILKCHNIEPGHESGLIETETTFWK